MFDPTEDKVKILHEAVSKKYDVGTLDEFKLKLQDSTKRKAFYDGVGKEYDLGDYGSFEEKVSQKKSQEQATLPDSENSLRDQLAFNPKEEGRVESDVTNINPIEPLDNRKERLANTKISEDYQGIQPLAAFNQGLVSGISSIPKAAGILTQKYRSLFGEEQPVEDQFFYQLGQGLDKMALQAGITATDPTKGEDFWQSDVPQALGSVGSLLLTGGASLEGQGAKELIVNAPKGLLGKATKTATEFGKFVTSPTAVASGAQMGVPEFEAAKRAGKSDDEAFSVFVQNAALGPTEALTLSRAFSRVNKIAGGKIVEILKAGVPGGIEQATQEAVQSYFSNMIAKGSYDPSRDPMMDVVKSGKAGFVVGFMLPGIIAASQTADQQTKDNIKSFVNDTLKEKANTELAKNWNDALNTSTETEAGATQEGNPADSQTQNEEVNDPITGTNTTGGVRDNGTVGQAGAPVDPTVQPETSPSEQQADQAGVQPNATPNRRVEQETSSSVLNKENLPLQNGIPQSISQGERGAENEGNRGVEDKTQALKTSIRTSLQQAQETGRSLSRTEEIDVQDRTAEKTAKENGTWLPLKEVTSLGDPLPSGNENEVFVKETDIFKVNNLSNSEGSILSFLDYVENHNRFFPESKYEVVGFTGRDNGTIYPITKQNHIDAEQNATPPEIEEYMVNIGFEKISDSSFTNGEFTVSDLHPRNVLKSSSGEIYVIDNIIKRNQPTQNLEALPEANQNNQPNEEGQRNEGIEGQQELLNNPEAGQDQSPDLTVGNYTKKNGAWYFTNRDGAQEKVLDLNQQPTQGQENPAITELKKIQAELQTPIAKEVTTQKERDRIKELPRNTLLGRARGYLLDGGKIGWNSAEPNPGAKKKVGFKDETGLSLKDNDNIRWIIDDKNGLSPEQIGEKLANKFGDEFSPQKYRNALIHIINSEPRGKWFDNQLNEEDTDLKTQKDQRRQEAEQIQQEIANLEAQEEGFNQDIANQYENERRVYQGREGTTSEDNGAVQQTRNEREAAVLIRENGDQTASQKAVEELKSITLTHVPNLGMGQNQAKGTYLSTEAENRYATESNPAQVATADIQNPFVATGNVFADIQRAAINSRFGKESIDDLDFAEIDLLAEMMSSYFVNEGYDSIYFPATNYQEGELVVFDRSKVTFNGQIPNQNQQQSSPPRAAKQNTPENGGEAPPSKGNDQPPGEGVNENNQRKKAVLNRALEGEGKKDLNLAKSLESHGLTYTQENAVVASQKAKDFVKEVGFDRALDAVMQKQIPDEQNEAHVIATLIDEVNNELAETTDETQRKALAEFEGRLVDMLSNQATKAGQFNAALAYIYQNSDFNFSLDNQVKEYKKRNNGTIEPEVMARYEALDKQLKEVQSKLAEAESKIKEAEGLLAIQNIRDSIEREKKGQNRSTKKIAEARSERAKLKSELFSRYNPSKSGGQINAALAPLQFIADVTKIANTYIKEGFANVERILEKTKEFFEKELGYKLSDDELTTVKETINKRLDELDETIGKVRISHKMIRAFVESGVSDINQLVSAIKETLIERHPNITDREIRDAITGYGETVNPNQEEIEVKIRKMIRIGRIISQMEDIKNQIRPLRSGKQRDKLEADERALNKELKLALKSLPTDEVANEKQLKNSLDAVKTRLQNEIEEINLAIETGKKSAKARGVTYDDEAKKLVSERDQLKEIYDAVFEEKVDDVSKIENALRSIQSAIDKTVDRINNNDIELRKKNTINTPDIRAAQERLKRVKDRLLAMQEEAGIPEKRRLQALKTKTKNEIEVLKEKLYVTKDFSKKPKPKELLKDNELLRLQAEKLDLKEQFLKEQYKIELKNRGIEQKIYDGFIETLSILRAVKSTGEFSSLGVQGWIYAFGRPIDVALPSIKAAFTSAFSKSAFDKSVKLLKTQEFYNRMKASKLPITETDTKESAQEETNTGSWGKKVINGVWAAIGTPARIYKPAYEKWKQASPYDAIERGNLTLLNTMRIIRYKQGEDMLRKKYADEGDINQIFINHPKDFFWMADVVGTMTGRASLGGAEKYAKGLSVFLYSARMAASIIKTTTPYGLIYAGRMGSKNTGESTYSLLKQGKLKPSVAQKMYASDLTRAFASSIGTAAMVALWANSRDDDEEPKVSVNTDPTSSDFGLIRIGNTRFDFFSGRLQMIKLQMRLLYGVTTDENGVEKRLGHGRTQTEADLGLQIIRNKLAPGAALSYKYFDRHIKLIDGKEVWIDGFGNELFEDPETNFIPMYFENINELATEQPSELAAAGMILNFFGLANSNTYSKEEQRRKRAEFYQRKSEEIRQED